MNALIQPLTYEQQIAIKHVICLLEPFERYAGKTGRNVSEQFRGKTIKSEDGTSWDFQDTFLTQLSVCAGAFHEKLTDVPTREYALKEFYKWVNHSGITANNCPRDFAHFLIEANSVLSGKGEEIMKKTREFLKNKKTTATAQDSLELFHSNQGFLHQNRDMKKSLENRDFDAVEIPKIKGNWELGRRVYEEIEAGHIFEHAEYNLFSPYNEQQRTSDNSSHGGNIQVSGWDNNSSPQNQQNSSNLTKKIFVTSFILLGLASLVFFVFYIKLRKSKVVRR
jgi:hypothetical protein